MMTHEQIEAKIKEMEARLEQARANLNGTLGVIMALREVIGDAPDKREPKQPTE